MTTAEQTFEEWWSVFQTHLPDETVDRNSVRLAFDFMHRQQPRTGNYADWSEHWLKVQKALDIMFNAASAKDMKTAEQQAAVVRDMACKLCCFFNEREFVRS
jgi:hypothetical protein